MNRIPLIEGEEILRLIPQRPPIVLIDCFYGIEGDHSYAGLTVTPDNLFCQNGQLQEAGMIEHIAQSAAARIGYLYTQKGEAVPLGFIGSVDKLKLYELPRTGNRLLTELTVVQEVGDITLIAARTYTGEVLLAECRMKIFLKKE